MRLSKNRTVEFYKYVAINNVQNLVLFPIVSSYNSYTVAPIGFP